MAFALVAAAYLFASAFRFFVATRYLHRTIHVTGSATRRIRSDRAIWRATVVARSTELIDAYRVLSNSTARVTEFLRSHHTPDSETQVGAVETQEIQTTFYERDGHGEVLSQSNRVTGYQLVRTITVVSSDLARVQALAQQVTGLLEQGVSVTSAPVEYLFSDLAGLKIELIAAATADARRRAEQVTHSAQARLGDLDVGNVGVVQINAANETATSWEGMNDRTSLEKDAMVTVATTFTVE